MTATETVSLIDYANAREDVVLFWASYGTPTGDYATLNHPDMDFAGEQSLNDLTGTVDADGDWRWDGEGEPVDHRNNTITKLHAYVDRAKWASIEADYLSGE